MDKREYTFSRKVNPRFEEGDVSMKHRGSQDLHHFRLDTGSDKDYFSRPRSSRREHFNEEFIKGFNEATGHTLDHTNRYVREELRRVHDGLERGDDSITFRVGRRME